MADDGDLIGRANALINAEAGAGGDRRDGSRQLRRRRSFLAAAAPGAVAPASPPGADDDDLPLLTDEVVAAPAAAADLRQTLTAELAQRLDQQLKNEMPALVEAALLTATDYLQHGIAATIEAILRDFVEQGVQAGQPRADQRSSPAAPPDPARASGPGQRRDPV